jgi:hypothetical protein
MKGYNTEVVNKCHHSTLSQQISLHGVHYRKYVSAGTAVQHLQATFIMQSLPLPASSGSPLDTAW